ncbi:MAG: aminodeoxychorismate synthase component I [Terracidiphilus sp.]
MIRWHPLPAEVYALVEQTPGTVLLETTKPSAPESRLFVNPLRVLAAGEPSELDGLFAEIETATAAGQFAAGFLTYECGNSFEPAAAMRPPQPAQPLAWFGLYDRCYRFDHQTGKFIAGNAPHLARFQAKEIGENTHTADSIETKLALDEPEYRRRVLAIHEWIRAGDVYQLNFTVPLCVRAQAGPAALYERLSRRQPVEFGAFLHWRLGRHILSFSPELFFRIEQQGTARCIVTRPMKGTAPRGRNSAEDKARSEWLRDDAKNRSENVMIVDLLRNDLGRICEFGSVGVENLFAVERFETLWQMTSTVTGELRPDAGFHHVLRALFPSGSVTGAPKVRAMQLLAQLEDEPRGVYTGAIGYFSAERTIFNVAIRTLDLDGAQGTMGVGSGIVIDSDPGEEFRECLLKAEFLTAPALGDFSLIESLLWQENFPLIELHLDRLADSADYFGFPCDRDEVKAALLNYAGEFDGAAPRKVRLLLHRDGILGLEDEVIQDPKAGGAKPALVRIAGRRTDPDDRMFFHKTTQRAIYAEALKSATAAGFDDVLFLNARGEVTEGAIHNVFIEKDGRWFTPPVECGLLAGVFRRHLLETRSGVEERVLRLDDLQNADAIYLTNAVRGLRRAVIAWETPASARDGAP